MTKMETNIIKTDGLVKKYVTDKIVITVLKNISLTVKPGEKVAIMGPSGAGKSTLLHILGLMSKPSSGEFCVAGVSEWSREYLLAKYRNRIIGFVFQSFNLLPEFSAVENVMMPALIAGEDRYSSLRRATKILDNVSVAHRAHHLPSELSGGEQQRVAIARALINLPKLFIADEPTGNLDKKTGNEVIDLLVKLQSEYKFTLLMATHNEEIALKCERIIKIVDGVII